MVRLAAVNSAWMRSFSPRRPAATISYENAPSSFPRRHRDIQGKSCRLEPRRACRYAPRCLSTTMSWLGTRVTAAHPFRIHSAHGAEPLRADPSPASSRRRTRVARAWRSRLTSSKSHDLPAVICLSDRWTIRHCIVGEHVRIETGDFRPAADIANSVRSDEITHGGPMYVIQTQSGWRLMSARSTARAA